MLNRARRTAALILALTAAGWGTGTATAAVEPAPQTVLVCGDSMMKTVVHALARELESLPSVRVAPLISIGTGLARPDVFDWPAQLREALKARPAAAVVLLGANDEQPLRVATGAPAPVSTPAWNAEYAARVAAMLRLLTAAGVKPIVWVGLPDMRDPGSQANGRRINAIVQNACAGVPDVEFLDTVAMFSRTAGVYSAYVFDARGMPLTVRASDGIHLNAAGADRLARALREKLVPRLTGQ